MHQRSAGFQRFFHVDYSRQWFKVDHDIIAGVFGDIARFSDDHCHRFTRESHPVLGDRHQGAGIEQSSL